MTGCRSIISSGPVFPWQLDGASSSTGLVYESFYVTLTTAPTASSDRPSGIGRLDMAVPQQLPPW